MKKDKEKISGKEKRRLKSIKEARALKNDTKRNLDFTFPRSRDIRFKEKK